MKIVSNKPTITRKELEGVLDCLINEELTSGSTVKSFESNIHSLVGLKYPLATNSLASAYYLVFHALGLQDGDEVILPSYITQDALSVLSVFKAKPVLVDNEENSIHTSVDVIKNAITDNTKAILVSHTMGFHFDCEDLYDGPIPIIEDISAAIGTEVDDNHIGSKATFAVISFAPSMVITTGNGGMVLTNNSKYFSQMREMRGSNEETLHLDFTMTDLQGAMGISQLIRLKDFIKRRRDIAKTYYDALRSTPHFTPFKYNDSYAYQSFPVIFDSPSDKVERFWKRSGIEVIKPIKKPLHLFLGHRGIEFPNSDRVSKKLYTVPLYPTLTKVDIGKIAKTLASFI